MENKKIFNRKDFSHESQILYDECLKIISNLKKDSSVILNEYSVQHVLIDLLLSKGYPEDSFVLEWEKDGLSFKLAIIDPETKNLLSVFEYYVSSPVVISSAYLSEILNKYKNLNSDPKVPLYIANAITGSAGISIHRILYSTKNSNIPHYVKIEELVSFSHLKSNVFHKKDMNNDFSIMTDEELEGIIRLHENPEVSGSRFQRAMTELDLRFKKRGYTPGIHLEAAGDITMDGSQIIVGENNTASFKTSGKLKSKDTKIIQKAKEKTWFTMDNPIVYILVILIIAAIAYLTLNYDLPFKFS